MAALSGAALAIGTLTKLFVVVAAVPALLYLLGGARGRSLGTTARLLAAFAGGGLLVTAGVLAPLWDRREAMYDQVIGVHLGAAVPGSGPIANLRMWGLASLAFLLRLQPLFHHHDLLLTPPAVLIAALAPLAISRSGQLTEDRARSSRAAPSIWLAVIAVVAVGTATTLYRARQPSGNLAVNKPWFRAGSGPPGVGGRQLPPCP